MIVSLSLWMNAHAKVLTLSGAMAAGAGGFGMTVHNYVVRVDADIEAVEDAQNMEIQKLDAIQADLTEVRCMTLTHYQEGNPLDCLDY